MRKKAYTLVEIILAIALFAVLFFANTIILQSFLQQDELESAKTILINSINSSYTSAKANYHDSNWGIKMQNSKIIIFKGVNYISRDTTFDESYSISNKISIPSQDEIVFIKISGKTVSNNTIIFQLNNKVLTFIVNEKGTIFY